nr:hypothetical protein [Caballeronia sp. ATUFL_M1_KS5A]
MRAVEIRLFHRDPAAELRLEFSPYGLVGIRTALDIRCDGDDLALGFEHQTVHHRPELHCGSWCARMIAPFAIMRRRAQQLHHAGRA